MQRKISGIKSVDKDSLKQEFTISRNAVAKFDSYGGMQKPPFVIGQESRLPGSF